MTMEIKSNFNLEGNASNAGLLPVILEILKLQLSGRLELKNFFNRGAVWFDGGEPKDAVAGNYYGETALKEILTWGETNYRFIPGNQEIRQTIFSDLQVLVFEANAFKQQIDNLQKAGLIYETILVATTHGLSGKEIEQKLVAGYQCDFATQLDLMAYLEEERTLADLVRDLGMDKHDWAPLLSNLRKLGLIEFKQPRLVTNNPLEFLGLETNTTYNQFYQKLLKPDTGLLDWKTFLLLLSHEFKRFKSQRRPLALILFDLALDNFKPEDKDETNSNEGTASLPLNAWRVAMARIALLTKESDILGHFMGDGFALLLPDTTTPQAVFVAEQIALSLTRAPLSDEIKGLPINIAFGVASMPFDGQELSQLVKAATEARHKARKGLSPVASAGM
jgi:diguanylate cyclase (GGDEF)-like protein